MTQASTKTPPLAQPVASAVAAAQHIDLRISAQDFFAMAQWAGPPLDLATETATSVLAWLK